MADTAVAGGLMAHQKDEHDIWICKDCGWKYPNAKPSPKIRKNHKKHCPGRAGADAHHADGSSDDASDDEHHASVKGSESTHEAATDVPVGSKTRSIDFSTASASAKEDVTPATPRPAGEAVNGNGKAVHDDDSTHAIVEKEVELQAKEAPLAVPDAASSPSGLMAHQKDEHDVWICKNCGWKYPNAKPSAKVRKHHKKQCAGKGGGGGEPAGGSSDEASDDEHHSGHHHRHHPPPAAPSTAASVSEGADNGITATAPAEAPAQVPANTSREIDFGALKEGNAEASANIPREVDLGTLKEESAGVEAAPKSAVPATASSAGGLMPHQKDEHDIWTCKDCGWKYPNAKPSAKVRKHHKKQCPGKGERREETGGSSDEASDDEHHSGHRYRHPSPAAPTAAAMSEGARNGSAATAVAQAPVDVPANTSREINFGALKEESSAVEVTPTSAELVAATTSPSALMPHQKDEHDIWTCKDCGWKYPNAKPSAKVRKHHKKQCPGKRGGEELGGSSDEASDDEHHSGHQQHHHPSPAAPTIAEGAENGSAAEAPASNSREIDFGALKKESEAEATPTSAGVLEGIPLSNMCACMELSTKAAAAPDSINDAQNSSFTSPSPCNRPAKLKKSGPEVPREIPESVTEREGESPEIKPDIQPEFFEGFKSTPNENPSKHTEFSAGPPDHEPTVVGGLLPHQRDEHDIWICRDCGWKYPNAKPSSKVRRHHKKMCPGKAPGDISIDYGASSDELSDDEHQLPSPSAPVEQSVGTDMPPALESGKSRLVSGNVTKEIDSEALDKSFNSEVESETTATSTADTPCGNDTDHGASSNETSDDVSPSLTAPETAAEVEMSPGTPVEMPPAFKFENASPEGSAELPGNITKGIDFEALKKSPNPEGESVFTATCTGEDPSAPAATGGGSLGKASDDEHQLPSLSPAAPSETAIEVETSPGAPVEMPPALESGNADPVGSPEVLGDTTKKLDFEAQSSNPEVESETTVTSAGEAPSATGTDQRDSLDEASGDASPSLAAPLGTAAEVETPPGAPVEMPPASVSGKADTGVSPDVPGDTTKEIDFEALKSQSPEVESETTATSTEAPPSATGTDGVSLNDVSNGEHHLPTPSLVAPIKAPPASTEVEMSPALQESGNAYPAGSHEETWNISKERGSVGHKNSPNPDMEGETTAASTVGTTAPVTETGTPKEKESSKALEGPATGVVSFKDTLLEGNEMEKEEPKKPVSLQEAIAKDSEQEKESKSEPTTEATVSSGGLMPHQKNESDIWVCKDCGWKYPNAKPSPKIRKNHKKKCPRIASAGSGAVVDGGTSDEGTDDEHHSITEKGTPAVTEAKADETAAVDDTKFTSREFSYSAAVQSSHAEPATSDDAGAPVAEKEEESRKSSETGKTVGGLMANQKDEDDVWVCRECGWRYPNAKPSPKVRKNHKKKCSGKNGAGAIKSKDGGSSDDASSDDDKFMVGKCFPCYVVR